MRVYANSPERKAAGFIDVYGLAIIFGVIGGLILISAVLGVKFIALYLIKNWVWAVVIVGFLLFIRHFFKRKQQPGGFHEDPFR